ncbi:MAG: hypothetical protein ACI8RZ_005663 [Myxococcota bacterium]|jgi:hypothetical protein
MSHIRRSAFLFASAFPSAAWAVDAPAIGHAPTEITLSIEDDSSAALSDVADH